MAEVGVLQLTIRDNSESAGKGLDSLGDALVRVKHAVTGGLGLEGIANEVVKLHNAISSAKGTSSTISKLGTMFNAINNFSKIKGFNINAEQLRDTALNMNKVADAMERQNEAVSKSNTDKNYWDNMLGNSDAKEAIKEAQRNVKSLDDLVKDAEASGKKGYANAWRTQMYSSGPTSRQSPGQIAMDIPELQQQVEGLKKVNETVEKSSEEYDRFKASVKGASSVATDARFDVKLASPIEALTSRVANCTETMQRFFDVVAHKPTTMSVASIEKATAENAKLAQAEIKSLIKTLQTPIKYKGLDEFVNTKTGVTSGAQKSLLNENTTMLGSVVAQQEALEREQRALMEATEAQIKLNEAGEAYAGVITVFDQAEGAFKKIQVDTSETAESIRNAIDLTQIPASGKNGAFANAAEEARYLQGEIEKTIASQQQWESIYNAAQKQMKYGGPRATEDLEFDMRHAAEGYDIAYEAELRYKDAFAELLDYAKEYKVTAEDTIPVINEQASSIQNLSTNISTMAAQAAANSSAIQQIFTALENPPQFKTADYMNQTMGIGADVKSAEDSYRAFLDLMGQETPQAATLRELNPEMLQLKQQMDDAGISASQFTSKMVDLDGELKRKKPDAESAAQGINKFHFSLKDMKKGLKQAFPLISQLGSRLKSIIIRRTLTAAIRKIVSSAKEGIQNVYEYSKLIGSSFAPAMDGAASSLAQMKNSLGAALAPLLQMLIPVLQQVVSWFINLVNYANQFFSLLNGQKTWTRALPQTVSAFDKQTKAAKSAGAAIKDLLADWDELNIIQSETGGGGGAGKSAAEDYLNMFEEVNTFDNKIKDIVNFIKDNFKWIMSAVEGIGLAILAWKISEAFGHSLGLLQKLSLAAGLTLMIAGIKITADAGYSIGKDGINGKNAVEAVGGVLATMLGGGLVGLAFGGIQGGLVGLIVGASLGLAVLAIKINQGHLDSLYGEATKSTEEIVDELKENVLTAEANLEVDIINANVKDTADAKTKVETALIDLATSYPINIEVTPDDANDFYGKVTSLVTATNNLIEQRKATMKKIEVPAMAVFGPSFVEDAWGGISAYVTELGTEIGTELSKSTVDAVKLDDLRKKLMEMSAVIANAQKTSEFTGSVSLISEGIRNNTKLGKYDRNTVRTYMEEYNKLLDSTRNTAADEALEEYVAAYTLVESLETKKRQMEQAGQVFDQEGDLEKAKQALSEMGEEADYIAKRSEDLFDEWTKAGRLVFGNTIAGALKAALANNSSTQSYYQRQIENDTAPRSTEIKNSDAWVRHYINDQYKDLYNIIATNSGMEEAEVKKLLENTGINPLSLLDETFVRQYQDKIVEWLGRSSLDDNKRKTILEAFGLNFEDVVFEPKIETQPQVEVEDKAKLAVDLYKEIEDIINASGLPKETIEIFNERLSQVTDLQTLQSLKTFIDQNGLTDAMRMLKNFMDGNGWVRESGAANTMINTNGVIQSPERVTGRGLAISDVGWGSNTDANATAVTEEDLAKAVETGTSKSNRDQNDILNSIMRGVEALLRKNWTVNITPTTSLGFVNKGAATAVEKITGSIV